MASFRSRLLNGFLWRLCLYVSSFLLNVTIANTLGADGSGWFYLLINNLSFIILVLGFGIDAAITYYASLKEVSSSYLVSVSFAWSIVVTIGMFMVYIISGAFNQDILTELTPYAILFIGSSMLSNCLAGVLYANDDNATPGIVFSVINMVLLLFLPGHPLSGTFTSGQAYAKLFLLVSTLPGILFATFLFARRFRFSFDASRHFFANEILPFAFKAFLYSLFYALLLRCDYWLVNYFCSNADLGNYLQATKLNQVILLIPSLASFTLFPLVVNQIKEEKEIDTKLVKLASIYFYTGLLICIGISVIGYWLLPFLYGRSFSKMYEVFLLLAPGVLALAAAYPFTTFFTGKNLLPVNIKALILSIVVIIGLDFLLIPRFGIYGAAIAATASYVVYFFLLATSFRKMHPFKWSSLLTIRELLKENLARTLQSLKKENED